MTPTISGCKKSGGTIHGESWKPTKSRQEFFRRRWLPTKPRPIISAFAAFLYFLFQSCNDRLEVATKQLTKKWKWSKTFQNCIWLLPRCTTTSYMGAIDEELWENLWKTSSKWKGIYLWLSMAVWCLPHRLPVFPDFKKKKDTRASTATTRKELQSPSSKMSQVSCLFRIVFWMFLTVFYWHVLFVARHLHVTKPGHFIRLFSANLLDDSPDLRIGFLIGAVNGLNPWGTCLNPWPP